MALQASCDGCFNEFQVPEKYAGRRVRCPACGTPVAVGRVGGAPAQAMPPLYGAAVGPRRAANRGTAGSANLPLFIGGGVAAVAVLVLGVTLGAVLGRGGNAAPQPMANQERPATLQPANRNAAPAFAAGISNTASAASVNRPPEAGADAGTDAVVASTVVAAKPAAMPMPAVPTPAVSTTTEAAKPASGDADVVATAPAVEPPAVKQKKLDIADLIELIEPSVVRVNSVTPDGFGHGSGFVADRNGSVVTNYHVVTEATKISVEFSDGRTVNAKGYRYIDPARDIAIIQLDLPPDTVPALPIAPALPRKGESVVGFGSPAGLNFTSSQGIISAIRAEQEMHQLLDANCSGTWLQTTAPISPGSSGGPLVDLAGNVVGINTMQLTSGQNLNFAISCEELRDAVAKAEPRVKPFDPKVLKPYDKTPDRDRSADEIGTDRGNKLMAAVDEIVLLNLARRADFDPTGQIWNSVIINGERAVERLGIKLSFGNPAPDAAVMLVFMELKPIRRGAPGAHEMVLHAVLICFDPTVREGEYCKVWEGEETVGTASIGSLAGGVVPNKLDAGLRSFFSRFKAAQITAVKKAAAQ